MNRQTLLSIPDLRQTSKGKGRAMAFISATFKRLSLLSLIAIPLLSACQKENKELTIGAIYNLTGGMQSLDVPSWHGAELAVAEINKSGGLLGKSVAFVVEDGETDTDVIAKKTAKLIAERPNMPVIIGLSDTDMVLAAARVAAKDKRIFITSGATTPVLATDVPTYLFLACFGDNVQAAAAADFVHSDLKAQKVAVLFEEGNSYTEHLHQYFETSFTSVEGSILSSKSFNSENLPAAVQGAQTADVVYLASTPDMVLNAIKEIRKAGFTGPIVGGDGLDIGDRWQQLPEEDNVYFTTHAYVGADSNNPKIIAFRKAFLEKFPDHEPDAFTALGYDTVNITAAAITKAGSDKVDAVLSALSTLKDFDGITGKISYTDGNPIPVKSVTMMRVIKGDEQFIHEVLPTNVPAP